MSKIEDGRYINTDEASAEDIAEYNRLLAVYEEARKVSDITKEAKEEAGGLAYDLRVQYLKTPTPELGQSLLKALDEQGRATAAHRDPFTRTNSAAEDMLKIENRLLTEKKLRRADHKLPKLFTGERGPVEICYLHGWTVGRPYDDDARGGVVIGWSQSGCGFGTMTFTQEENGTFSVQTEHMGEEFVGEVLKALSAATVVE